MVLLRSYSLCASVKIQPKIATIEIDWWQESKCNLYVIHFQYENIIHSWKWHNENNATQAKRSTILSIINYLHTNELDISEIMKMPWNQSLNTDETMHEQEHGKTSSLALTLSLAGVALARRFSLVFLEYMAKLEWLNMCMQSGVLWQIR